MAAAALLAGALGAPAAPRGGGLAADIAQMRGKPCPTYRNIFERRYSRERVELARRKHRFTVYRGLKAKLRPHVNWAKNPHRSRGFRASLQTLKFLDVLLYAYRAQRSRAALRQAKALALDWVRSNPGPAHSRSGLAWIGKVVGERAPYLAYLVRALACERMLTRRQAPVLVASVRRHGAWLADPAHHYPSNHGLFMDAGLLLLAGHYFPFLDGAHRWERLARARFPRTLAGRISREGAWMEHSVGYHFLVMRVARRFGELGGGGGRIRGQLRRLGRAGAWFVAPDGRLAQLGDTDLEPAPKRVSRLARHRRGMKVMRQAGFAFVREGGSYLAVTAGFHNRSHKQADDSSFELFEGGQRIVAGPGKYGFDRDRKRRYVLSARSHSVLTVNGRSFSRDPRLAYGSGIVSARRAKGWYAIAVRNPLLRRNGVTHRRTFLYRPGEALLIVDRVRSGRARRYRRFLQLGPAVEVERRDRSRLALRAGAFHGCVEDAPYTRGRLARRAAVRGRGRPFRGWTFPQALEPVPRWSVSYSSRAVRVRHVLSMDLDGGCASELLGESGGDLLPVEVGE